MRTTTINLQENTEKWLKNKGMKATFAMNNLPEWHDRLMLQGIELIELRKFKESTERQMFRLQSENVDLMRFRLKVAERMKKGGTLLD